MSLEDVQPLPAAREYTDFLLATAATGTIGEHIAAMAPCSRLYGWLGQRLADAPHEDKFGFWIRDVLGAGLSGQSRCRGANAGPERRRGTAGGGEVPHGDGAGVQLLRLGVGARGTGVRASLVRWLLVAAALSLLVLAAACTDELDEVDLESAGVADEPVELDAVRLQLDWLPNTNHTGVYVAMAQGWYEEEGIEIEILPYSGASGEVLIDQSVADVAFSFPTNVPHYRASGIDVVSIAAVLQSNPTEMAVLADGEITRPRDLDGGTYGGFGSPAEQAQWEWVIKADGGEGEDPGR